MPFCGTVFQYYGIRKIYRVYQQHCRKGIQAIEDEISVWCGKLLLVDGELGLERPISFADPCIIVKRSKGVCTRQMA